MGKKGLLLQAGMGWKANILFWALLRNHFFHLRNFFFFKCCISIDLLMSVSPGMRCPFSVWIVKIHHWASGAFSSLKLKVTFASLSSVCSALSDLLCLAARSCVYFIPKHQTAHSAPSLSLQQEVIEQNRKTLLGFTWAATPVWNCSCESRLFVF